MIDRFMQDRRVRGSVTRGPTCFVESANVIGYGFLMAPSRIGAWVIWQVDIQEDDRRNLSIWVATTRLRLVKYKGP
jgi:hypothetical protein